MLYVGYVRYLRTDGKRPGPWLCVTLAVPSRCVAEGLTRAAARWSRRAEVVVLPAGEEPVAKRRA